MKSHDLLTTVITEKYNKLGKLLEKRIISGKLSGSYINIKVNNSDGTLDKELSIPFRSYTTNFMKILRAPFVHINSEVVELDGGAPFPSDTAYFFSVDYPDSFGPYNYGIVVGGDDGTGYPLATDNYKLGNIIAHGTTVGKLQTVDTTIRTETIESGGKLQFSFYKTFTNVSGSSIDVKEIGVYTKTIGCCIIRDILPATVTVNNGQTLTVTYTLKVNKSEGWTLNFLKFLSHGFFYKDPIKETITRIDNTTQKLTVSVDNGFYLDSGYGQDYFGVQVGTCSSGLSSEVYKLYDQIYHGYDPGELVYHRYNYAGVSTTASGAFFEVSRPFSNESTAPITIEEVGLVAENTGVEGEGVLFIRTLTGGVTLQPNESVKVRFKFEANI